MSIITVTIPSPGGTATMADSTALAIAAQTTTNGILMEKLLGSGAIELSKGGLVAQAARTAGNTQALADKMDTLIGKFNEVTTAVSKINKGQEDILTALANAHLTAVETKVIQTMSFAAQVDNNKFQQKATNAALKEAGKPEIKVEPDELVAETLKMVQTVGTINTQVSATSLVLDTVTSYLSKGLTLAQSWVAQSAFGKFVTDYYAIAKIQVQLLWADEKTAIVLKKQQLDIENSRLSPLTTKAG